MSPQNVITPRSTFPRDRIFRRSNLSARCPASGPISNNGTAETMSAVVNAVIDGALVKVNNIICARVSEESASELCEMNWPLIANRKSLYLNKSRRRT